MNYQRTYQYKYIVREDEPVILPDVYCYTPARGFAWLQRLAIWLLRKLNCQYISMEPKYSTRTVDLVKVRDLVMKQREAIMRTGLDKIRGIILGPQEAYDLLNQEMTSQPYGLTLPLGPDIRESIYHRGEYRGLQLYVLPWAEGVTLLPEL